MPLSKQKNRERMRTNRLLEGYPSLPVSLHKQAERVSRATCVQPNAVHPELDPVQPKLEAVGLKMDGNRLVGIVKPGVQPTIPLYNPAIHRAGDTVRVYQGKRLVTMTIPELDGDGNPVYLT